MAITPNILLVEDEKNLGQTLSEYLNEMGFPTAWANNVSQAQELFTKHNPQIILMDVGLPDGNGFDLAKNFRKSSKNSILFFLSAQNDPQTRLEGLEIGAEDYITKPFQLKELVLRLNRSLGQIERKETLPLEISHGALKIWFSKFEVQDGKGKVLNLSQKECHILQLLYQNAGSVVSRDQIIESIWGEDKFPSNRTVDNYIVKLRKWTETDPSAPLTISSVRSVGYKLNIKK